MTDLGTGMKRADVWLMAKICHLYYRKQLNQTEIGKRLGISRFRVSRILKKALDTGMVRIEIVEPQPYLTSLEMEFEERFGLKSVILIENQDAQLSDQELKKRVGQAAADYLLETLVDSDVLGIGWGTTTNEVVNALPVKIDQTVEVIQITGGNKSLSVGIDCQELTRRLASKFKVEPHLLHAPAVVDRKETRNMLLQESSIKETFDCFRNLTVTVVGIGSIFPEIASTLLASGYLDSKELQILRNKGAVGDAFSYFFDIEGHVCKTKLQERFITIPLEDVKRASRSIGVATGKKKAHAILGAIRGGFINTLVTDSSTAKEILVLEGSGESRL